MRKMKCRRQLILFFANVIKGVNPPTEREIEMNLELYAELQGHKSDVNCAAWSPEDQTLCSCGGDKTLRLWSVHEKKETTLSPITAHQHYVNSCAYSPAGDVLASGSSDTTIKLWSTTSWGVLGE